MKFKGRDEDWAELCQSTLQDVEQSGHHRTVGYPYHQTLRSLRAGTVVSSARSTAEGAAVTSASRFGSSYTTSSSHGGLVPRRMTVRPVL